MASGKSILRSVTKMLATVTYEWNEKPKNMNENSKDLMNLVLRNGCYFKMTIDSFQSCSFAAVINLVAVHIDKMNKLKLHAIM